LTWAAWRLRAPSWRSRVASNSWRSGIKIGRVTAPSAGGIRTRGAASSAHKHHNARRGNAASRVRHDVRMLLLSRTRAWRAGAQQRQLRASRITQRA